VSLADLNRPKSDIEQGIDDLRREIAAYQHGDVPNEMGTARAHQAGSMEAEWQRRARANEEDVRPERSQATRSYGNTDLIPPRFRRPCKKCNEPLPVGAPRHQLYHKNCEEAVRKARYRARLKAKRKELKQMLGLEPIDVHPEGGAE
jgi:hypothetical protein